MNGFIEKKIIILKTRSVTDFGQVHILETIPILNDFVDIVPIVDLANISDLPVSVFICASIHTDSVTSVSFRLNKDRIRPIRQTVVLSRVDSISRSHFIDDVVTLVAVN